ncbi:MAG: sulfatase-like hydrolase/transferase [Candidatus Sumerlaeota bacterium]|nr:sulfatase-like hydrolase/transferase [Candidatus Sumerlaeota bacterium]
MTQKPSSAKEDASTRESSHPLDRRHFLQGALAAGALAAAGGGIFAAENEKEQSNGKRNGARGARAARPNILVIMSDEHNATVTGCYGNKLVQTPHLDGLSERGVTFDAAYTNSPLCVPCRQSFTMGKYISRIGAWSNSCMAPPDSPSLPRVLNAAGYESFLCGKMHYDATCRYGFTDVGGSMNNGRMTGNGGRRPADDLAPKGGLSPRFEEFRAGDKSSVITHDLKVTEGAVEFLSKRKRAEKPFFLFCGYLAPHFPLIVPEAFWERYKGKVPMPEIPAGHLESQPLNYQHLRAGFSMANVPPQIVRKGRELYYGFTSWVDTEIGKVLKTLKDSEAANDTVIIYTTDHGENMGEHGLWWKNCMYQHAARVPLIVSWPERWKGGQRRGGACSLVDAVQTIAAIGGAQAPADWNGASMLPWLDNPAAPWKDMAVSEYYAHNIASGYAMLRAGQYKYVYHTPADAGHPAQRELYDLKADPGEFANLAGSPNHKERIGQLHAALIKEIGEDPDKTEQRCRADYAKGYDRNAGGGGGKRGKKGSGAAESDG